MNRLQETRKRRGVSQIDLALSCRVHPASLARIERGVRCTKATARRIAEALDEKPEELFPDFATLRGEA